MVKAILDKKFLKQLETYIKVVDGLELFCKQQMCSALDQKGNPLVVDTGHISHLGSSILAKAIFSELDEKKWKFHPRIIISAVIIIFYPMFMRAIDFSSLRYV